MTSADGVRCPKCEAGGSLIVVIEHFAGTMIWDQDEEGKISSVGYKDDGSGTGRVTAQCGGCGHQWTLRGILHVGQLKEKFGEYDAERAR